MNNDAFKANKKQNMLQARNKKLIKSESKKHIAVVGAGSWGTALAIVLARNGFQVNLWDIEKADLKAMIKERVNRRYLPGIPLPDNIAVHLSLKEAVKHCRDILLVVPSQAFHKVLKDLKPFTHATTRIAWGTKGLDKSGKLLHEVAQKTLGKIPMAVVSGPTFAHEVAQGLPTAITVAGTDKTFTKACVNYLHNPAFRVYTSDDIVGVQIGGVVKNSLAIATGISDGMGFGANARSALITRGLAELMRFGKALGAKTETLMGLAGLGDLVLTCTDDQSRNRRFGLAIGKGSDAATAEQAIGQVVEGIANTKLIYDKAKQLHIEMPIVEQVYNILYSKLSPQKAVKALLGRPSKTE